MELNQIPQTNTNMIRKLVYLRDNKDKIDFGKLFQRLTGKQESEQILRDLIIKTIENYASMMRVNARIILEQSIRSAVEDAAKYFEDTRDSWHEQSMFIELDPAAQLGQLVSLDLLQFTPDKGALHPTDYCIGLLCGRTQQMLIEANKV